MKVVRFYTVARLGSYHKQGWLKNVFVLFLKIIAIFIALLSCSNSAFNFLSTIAVYEISEISFEYPGCFDVLCFMLYGLFAGVYAILQGKKGQ